MTKTCPCCGHPIPPDIAAQILRGRQRHIYETVRAAGVMGISMQNLMRQIYADDVRGGPDYTITALVWHLNQKIRKYGLVVRGQRGPGSVYTLRKLENTNAADQ